jgi:hypothetical protein
MRMDGLAKVPAELLSHAQPLQPRNFVAHKSPRGRPALPRSTLGSLVRDPKLAFGIPALANMAAPSGAQRVYLAFWPGPGFGL